MNMETKFDDTELRAKLDDLIERYEEMAGFFKSTLAENEMMCRVFDADDRIAASMDEATRQSAIAECSTTQFQGQQPKLVEMSKQVTYWEKRAKKAEKELARRPAATA
jgi:hypothetical protein